MTEKKIDFNTPVFQTDLRITLTIAYIHIVVKVVSTKSIRAMFKNAHNIAEKYSDHVARL